MAAQGLPWPAFYEKTRDRPPWPLVIEAAAMAPGRRALDLGAGAGRDTRYLLEAGFEVTAVDASPELRAILAGLPNPERLRVVISRFELFDFEPDGYDLVNAAFALPFTPPEDFERVFDSLRRSLRPAGIFAGQVFGTQDTWNQPGQGLGDARLTFHTRPEVDALLEGMGVPPGRAVGGRPDRPRRHEAVARVHDPGAQGRFGLRTPAAARGLTSVSGSSVLLGRPDTNSEAAGG